MTVPSPRPNCEFWHDEPIEMKGDGSTWIKGNPVYINGEVAGAGGIQELADGETLENRGVNLSESETFDDNNRHHQQTLYRDDQPSGTSQCVAISVMPTFDEPIRIKSLRPMVYLPQGAPSVELEYGICSYDGYLYKDPIGTFTPRSLDSATITDYPLINIDREIGGGQGIYIALPSDGTTTSTAICGRASDDYVNEFPAIDITYNGSSFSRVPWGYSMACWVSIGNTTINRVTGVDIGNGEPMDVKSAVTDADTGRLYFDKENRKVYAGFDGEWEDISQYYDGELGSGETLEDRGVTMASQTTHTITETAASPDSITLKATPATGEIGYVMGCTPNGVSHTIKQWTPKVTVSGASSMAFTYGVAYQYGGYWEFFEEGNTIVPPASSASPTYPALTFSYPITLDDNTAIYLKPDLDCTLYAEVSTDSGEVEEHNYLTVAKTDEGGWRHTLVTKAIAGNYVHVDNIVDTRNKLTGVDIVEETPSNGLGADITGKLCVDSSNNRFYVGIGTHWYPITLGTPI